jgi:thiol-disulfide isomerase/thioredoxin
MSILLRHLISGMALGFIFLAALGFALSPVVVATPRSNDESVAGDLPLIDLAGYRDVVARNRGKGVMVAFWATWCEPCRDEYPLLVSLAKEYAPQGLAVIGVDLDEDSETNLVRKFLAQNRPGFPNYRVKTEIDSTVFFQTVSPEWKGAMPETAFYARDGHLARNFFGKRQREAFVDAIRLILAAPISDSRSGGRPVTGS